MPFQNIDQTEVQIRWMTANHKVPVGLWFFVLLSLLMRLTSAETTGG